MNKTIYEAIEEYEAEHEFTRQVTLPVEDRIKFMAIDWEGGYRWFRSPKVFCLEKYRQIKAKGLLGPS